MRGLVRARAREPVLGLAPGLPALGQGQVNFPLNNCITGHPTELSEVKRSFFVLVCLTFQSRALEWTGVGQIRQQSGLVCSGYYSSRGHFS